MVTFEFKRTNQEVTPHYCPPAPTAGGSADAIYRVVVPGPAPTWALPPASTSLKPYRPLSPPCHLLRALPPRLRVLPPPVWVVAPFIGTSLMPSGFCLGAIS
jgi:hypothetical protein